MSSSQNNPAIAGKKNSVRISTKLWFGLGATGESTTNWIFNALAFIYYQQILGLSGTLTGAAVLVGILSDAFTDPVMGSISDSFRSRFGRRHPFMFAAPIPLAASVFLMFNPPESVILNQTLLFSWFLIFTVLMRSLLTLFAVPHLAMGAELSSDYIERSKIMSYNNLFGFYGGFLMHCFVWFLIFGYLFEDRGGQLHGPAYQPIVLFCCVLIVLAIMGCAWFTRDQIPKLMAPDNTPPFTVLKLFTDIWAALKNTHYRYLLLGLFFLSMTIGTHETLAIYMGTFFWELSPYQIGWLVASSVIGYHIGFTLTSVAHRHFDKRWTIVGAAAGLSVFWSTAVTLRLLGLAPENSTWGLVAFIISIGIFSSACGSILNISVMSALADIADEHELNTGRRQEGIFYSARTFFSKVTNGIGHLVAGIALDFYIFLPAGAVPGEVPEDVLFRLGVVDGPFAMIFGLIAACIYAGYRIDHQYHADIKRRLDEIKASKRNLGIDITQQ